MGAGNRYGNVSKAVRELPNVSNGLAIEGGLQLVLTKMILSLCSVYTFLRLLGDVPGYIRGTARDTDSKGYWTAEQSWPNQDCCEGTCARILLVLLGHPRNMPLLLQSEMTRHFCLSGVKRVIAIAPANFRAFEPRFCEVYNTCLASPLSELPCPFLRSKKNVLESAIRCPSAQYRLRAIRLQEELSLSTLCWSLRPSKSGLEANHHRKRNLGRLFLLLGLSCYSVRNMYQINDVSFINGIFEII